MRKSNLNLPCALCGKLAHNPIWFEFVSVNHSLEVTVIPGSTNEKSPKYMGIHPVGRTCAKKLPTSHQIQIDNQRLAEINIKFRSDLSCRDKGCEKRHCVSCGTHKVGFGYHKTLCPSCQLASKNWIQ